ncbi:MAG: MoxR family ATPase [Leptospiraceae bacterium]|nr:MoxR family ATPase [Leptospiraceae bacterium]MCP5496004.1 MoxR family ATPase [Leptospiraceae bacterium]
MGDSMGNSIQESTKLIKKVSDEIHTGIIGQIDLVEGLLLALLADGHILIEGVPGLAKTRAVNLLANICKVTFKRLQFTPDLLPADIIGTRIYNQSTASFETKKGPIFANFILADEINRAPAKVQSALLETMQEKQVTIGDETFFLQRPFLVFATQNPVEQEGTYPLPEAQVDRFLMKLVVTYPTMVEEQNIVKMVIQETKLPSVRELITPSEILTLQDSTMNVFIEDKLIKYITDIVFATREPEKYGLKLGSLIQYGGSPRASIAMAMTARAKALLDGRDSVYPEDIKAVAHNVLRHRVIPTYHADAEGITSDQMIQEIMGKIKVP